MLTVLLPTTGRDFHIKMTYSSGFGTLALSATVYVDSDAEQAADGNEICNYTCVHARMHTHIHTHRCPLLMCLHRYMCVYVLLVFVAV